jgi:sugar phosphate isomerase/epimerase
MNISTIRGLKNYLNMYSNFSDGTICNVIKSLGFDPLHATSREFKELSGIFMDCSNHGADTGFSGFIYYSETRAFFKENQQDIARHMEKTAAEMGTDIITMVQGFGVFRYDDKPTPSEIGKALWGNSDNYPELMHLHNVFAWYALEEVSRTWYRYLEENPAARAELSA